MTTIEKDKVVVTLKAARLYGLMNPNGVNWDSGKQTDNTNRKEPPV